jgi:hypothetical protein
VRLVPVWGQTGGKAVWDERARGGLVWDDRPILPTGNDGEGKGFERRLSEFKMW